MLLNEGLAGGSTALSGGPLRLGPGWKAPRLPGFPSPSQLSLPAASSSGKAFLPPPNPRTPGPHKWPPECFLIQTPHFWGDHSPAPWEDHSPHMSSSEPSTQSGKESHCCLMRTHWPLAHRNWLGRQTAARRGLEFREARGHHAMATNQCSLPCHLRPKRGSNTEGTNGTVSRAEPGSGHTKSSLQPPLHGCCSRAYASLG